MKRTLVAVLVLALSLSLPVYAIGDTYQPVSLIYKTDQIPDFPIPTLTPTITPFKDCDNEVITLAYMCGIVDGHAGEFRPLDTLTKAEWAQMLYNAFGPRFPRESRPAEKPWFYQATTWLGLEDQAFADSASYDWCVKTAYQLWCRGGEIEFDAEKAAGWALTYGAGPKDAWRKISDQSDFMTRTEAVYLLITLGELELNPLG